MASLIENLYDVLEKELSCYQQVYDFANKKTDIIINNDIEKLDMINHSEQELAAKISHLEKIRESVIKDIGMVLNQSPKDLTIKSLITLLSNSKKDQVKLQILRNSIIDILNKVKEKNEQNKILIDSALDYVEFTMNGIQSKVSGPETNDYEDNGKSLSFNQAAHYFDARQ